MSLINLVSASEQPRRCHHGMLAAWRECTKETECHDDFHYWMGLAQISAAMGRRFYLDQRMFVIYPNMYLILIGESGFSGKSTAIGMAQSAYKEAFPGKDAPLLAQKVSPSSLIGDLLRVSKNNADEASEGVLVSSELSILLGNTAKDDEILKVLTDLWDCPNQWEYSTRVRGQEILNNVCLNIWGGSTPSWFKTGIPESSLEGGFFSRLILVDRPRSVRRIAMPHLTVTPQMEAERANFVHDLKRIFTMRGGGYTFTPEAASVYCEWYENDLDKEAESAGPAMRSYFARKRTFVLKLAMVLALEKSDDLKIKVQHIQEALAVLDQNESHLSELLSYLGSTKDGMELQFLIKEFQRLWKGPKGLSKDHGTRFGIKHSDLLSRVNMKYNAMQLEMMVRTLEESGFLEVVPGERGNRMYLSKPNSFEQAPRR
jgi:hypothetical protein